MQYIEVRIQNNFEIIKQTKIINNNIMPLFTLEMLRGVFNGIKDNEMAKINKLQAMVNELNRIHIDGKPMYVHYKLDTRTRIEHFFAQ
ncbi:hypothetical protein, partial [Helicobacter sp. MIT 05-5294]|uniref:hypothetical protein n=1 Tax=Helicobacter sp. MIT 05-5294 TaxID=1548150 RepID=UPI0010FD0ECB